MNQKLQANYTSKEKEEFHVVKSLPDDRIIALAGNPNVGKSTVFNYLTKMHQHTGNWPGKTVACTQGTCNYKRTNYILVDLPGTYSLMAHSEEEEVARDFICSGKADATVVVCDATCLERNLNLVLQILDITEQVIVCVNLCDEAQKKGIVVDFDKLSQLLGVPVISASAAKGRGMSELTAAIAALTAKEKPLHAYELSVPIIGPGIPAKAPCTSCDGCLSKAAGLLSGTHSFVNEQGHEMPEGTNCQDSPCQDCTPMPSEQADSLLADTDMNDMIEQVAVTIKRAEEIAGQVVQYTNSRRRHRDLTVDRLVTGSVTGVPIMLLALAVVFWLTITGANYPSAMLADGLFWIQDRLMDFAVSLGAPAWFTGSVIEGMYRVLAWVVSVMLPPMAIFFPLFTLLEDLGYLPRIAFNLDRCFKKCCACGKQGLTMCMGFVSL